MIEVRLALGIATIAAVVLLSSCGSDGGGGEPNETQAAPAVAAKANAICREFRHEIRQIGLKVPGNLPPGTLAETTKLLVEPSILVLERTANRLQALKPAAESASFELYAGLFDPLIVLAGKRLEAGRAGDSAASEGFDAMLTDFGIEQRRAAELAGLRQCDVDFEQVLVSSLTE